MSVWTTPAEPVAYDRAALVAWVERVKADPQFRAWAAQVAGIVVEPLPDFGQLPSWDDLHEPLKVDASGADEGAWLLNPSTSSAR